MGISEKELAMSAIELPLDQKDVFECDVLPVANQQFRTSLLEQLTVNTAFLDEIDLNLRLNQLNSLTKLKERLSDPNWNLKGYFVQPTGAGKTVLFGIMARLLTFAKSSPPLTIFVPKKNLLKQTKAELMSLCGFEENEIGMIGDGDKEIGRKVTIVTYASHMSLIEKSSEYQEANQKTKIFIYDEAHRALGEKTLRSTGLLEDEELEDEELEDEEKTIEEEIAEMEADSPEEVEAQERVIKSIQKNSEILQLGFTATPKLARKNVADVFDDLIARETFADLVQAGILVKVKLIHIDEVLTLGEDAETLSNITLEQENRILSKHETYQKLLESYKQTQILEGKQFKGIVYCSTIDECDNFIALASQSYGLEGLRITGRESADDLETAEELLLEGSINFIVTVDKLTEGWNLPPVDAVMQARCSLSPARILQGTGRAMRGGVEGKDFAYVFEPNWQIARQARNGNGGNGETQDGKKENETDETGENTPRTQMLRKYNLIEALLESGEEFGEIESIFHSLNGKDFAYESSRLTADQARELILKLKPTPADWAQMNWQEKKLFEIGGRKLVALARLFGVEGTPVGNHSVHLEWGKKIYGNNYPEFIYQVKEDLTTQQAREQILQLKPTPKDWIEMKREEKKAFGICGHKLVALAWLFGVPGNPIGYTADHLELGKMIYGDSLEFVKKDLTLDQAREQILELKPIPADWAKMKTKEKEVFEICGRKLRALARLFGEDGNPVFNHNDHLKLGKKIYGEDCVELNPEELTVEKARELVLELKPTPADWAKMKTKEKEVFEICGRKLQSLATLFGLKGSPVGNHPLHLELGKKIYGSEHPEFIYEVKEELPELTVDQARELILRLKPMPADWAGMQVPEKKPFKICGRKLSALATLFGLTGDPANNHPLHLELGEKIYGEGHPEFAYKVKEELTATQAREQILQLKPTPADWVGMNQKEKKVFEICGRKLGALATIFGFKGNPANNHPLHLELGKKIYGEGHSEFDYEVKEKIPELTVDQAREQILQLKPTPADWVGMKGPEKKVFEICGRKLTALARLFGVKDDPVNNNAVYLELGKKIYGAEHPEFIYEKKEELTIDQAREQILELKPKPADWAGMNIKEKKLFEICGRKLIALARLFGVEGNPLSNNSVHLELGKKIYGDSPEFERKK